VRTIRTAKKRKALIAAVEACAGNVTRACKLANVSRNAVWEWSRDEPAFSDELEAAIERGADLLEEEAVRRAYVGVEKPVYQGGALVGHVQEYSDTLLIFLLKGKRPERYRERVDMHHTGEAVLELTFGARAPKQGVSE